MALWRRVLAALAVVWAVVWGATAASADQVSWTWPLPGEPAVTRAFDPPEVRYAAGHRGADLASAPGAGVVAAGAGRVSYAGLLAGRGVIVVVHGDLRTTYEPVTAQVAVGDVVAAGQLLGRLDPGHEGCPVAACLHWGLRRGETYLDPVQLVQRAPVRLLPLGAAAAAPADNRVPLTAVLRGSVAVGAPAPAAPVDPGMPAASGAAVVLAAAGAAALARRSGGSH